MKKRILYICLVLTVVAGCAERDPATLFAPSAGVLVIDATLIVGDSFPTVLLSETGPADEVSRFAGTWVSDADIRIFSDTESIGYANTGPGEYKTSSFISVQPRTTYRIDVRTTDGRFLTATTTTPGSFQMDRWVLLDDAGQSVVRDLAPFGGMPDSAVYEENQLTYSEGLLEAWYTPTAQPGYQIGILSLDLDSPLIINPDFIDDEDLADLERETSSPVIDGSDGKIRMPWFAIFFEGRYKIKVYTLDNNWFDFVRSNPDAGGFGFGGNAGDSFPEPIFHVEGGIGLFGSAAVDSVGLTFLPRP